MRSGLKVIRAVAVWLLGQPPLRHWPLLEAASEAPSPPRAKAPREAGVAASLQWSARPLKIQSWVSRLPHPPPLPCHPVLSSQSPPSSSPRTLGTGGAALGDAEAPLGVGRKEVKAESVSGGGEVPVCTRVCAPRPTPDADPARSSCCVYFLSTSCESGVHPCSVRLYSSPFCGTRPRFPQPVSCFLGQPTPIRLQNPLRAAPPQAAAHHVAADTQGTRVCW